MATHQDFLKRRTFTEGYALTDAAHVATFRLYCYVLRFWRRCSWRACKRHRQCRGDPFECLPRGLIFVPQSRRLRAQQEVIAGGLGRKPPASHIEYQVRRTALQTVLSWRGE